MNIFQQVFADANQSNDKPRPENQPTNVVEMPKKAVKKANPQPLSKNISKAAPKKAAKEQKQTSLGKRQVNPKSTVNRKEDAPETKKRTALKGTEKSNKAEIRKKIDERKCVLEELKSELGTIEKSISELEEQNKVLESEICKSKKVKKDLKAEINKMKKNVDEIQDNFIMENEEKNQYLEFQYYELKFQIESIKEENHY